ncbi:hypothetical protein TNCV_4418451 [Trichonephila clavipes]|nr:hypothetical protein TNCV_4418451 [Trichonephila clavipes]
MDIAVWGALSGAKIVALDHNNTESDEDESEELTPVTLSETKVTLNKLRNFFHQNHVDADILQASFVLENSIEKTKVVDSWLAFQKFKPHAAEDLPNRGCRCKLSLSRVKRPPVSVKWKLEERVPSRVSSSSLTEVQNPTEKQ